ncbi:type II toxin-antitoxin system MqsA family antitoxin [Roseofilum sp. BLCC_M154]|uniref:Type II toxin-antitoxin system MqsA family antitoxin n=1 Tax=Roseofilum acuticapitatum BLCC-M154 TaxID=3022444 RepID=A0ABT7ASX1_9CYAN|nr:type II toxin-antitoxin system MqsA family antitoxin [Roseofilum acuticapitatum]MDJ1169990.1 type II toxin-antitoxin system MqsA family antitoxin [Roseofilum acuticapitatum BLCC-M154]
MFCDICGNEGVNIQEVTRTYGKGEDLLIIEGIPIINCPHCGERYLSAETLHKIESIQQHRKELAVARSVEVAGFS